MNRYLFSLFSSLAFASLGLILATGSEGWKEFSQKLFENDQQQMSQLEILDYLKQLETILDDNQGEATAVALKEDIKHLIDVSIITPDKCTSSDFRRVRSSIEHYEGRSSKLLNYLVRCQEEQFRACKSIFANQLKEAVDKLDEQDRLSVVDLASGIELPIETANIWLPSRVDIIQYSKLIASGVLDYLERLAGHRLSSKVTMGGVERQERTFMKRFEESVGNICRVTMISLDPQTVALRQLYNADKLMTELDKPTLDWVKRVRVCHFIFVLGNTVGHDAFAELVNRENKGQTV